MPNLLKKILLIIAVVLVYFLGIREVRKAIHGVYLGTILPSEIGVINDEVSFYAQSSVSFTICTNCEEYGKGWQFKIPFGSFFLFSVIGLMIIGENKESYLILTGFHFSMGVLTVVLVLVAINSATSLFIIVDFISRYLLPLGSFGYVAYIYGKSKMKNRLHANQS